MRQLLLYVFILVVGSVSAEQFKLTGTVVDAKDKEPLICATVTFKGTNRSVCADLDGNFSIEVEKGDTLEFSFAGCFSKEVVVLNDSSLVIELEDDPEAQLDIPGVGPSLCPCPAHTYQRYKQQYYQNYLRHHLTKKDQDSVINQ